MNSLTVAQWHKVKKLSKINKMHHAMFMLAYSYGLRVSELAGLEMKDITKGFTHITIRPKKKGRALKKVEAVEYMLIPEAKKALKAYLKLRGDEPGPIFIGRQGGYSTKRIQQFWKEYSSRVGTDLAMHCFRHSRAQHMYDAGADLGDIKDMLRHACITSTLEYAKTSTVRRDAYLMEMAV